MYCEFGLDSLMHCVPRCGRANCRVMVDIYNEVCVKGNCN